MYSKGVHSKGVYLRECDLALPVVQESERVESVGGDAHLVRGRVRG